MQRGARLAPLIEDRAPALRSQDWRFALELADRAIPGKPHHMQNVFSAHRVEGPLDVVALREALDQLAVRHAALRTAFVRGDQLEQIVRLDVEIALELVDLRAAAGAERDAASRSAIKRATRHAFDLTRAPLIRCQVQQLAAAVHVIVLTGHHIVLDAWSLELVLRDLLELHADIATGGGPPARPSPRQLPDVARDEHAWLASTRAEPERAYWRARFARPPRVVELPDDRRPQAAPAWCQIVSSRRISATAAAPIRALAAATDATLYIVLLAGFVELLHRWTAARDVTFCTTHAGRSRVDLEDTVGDLTKTLLLRVAWHGAPSFRELIAITRAVVLGADAHKELPCSDVLALAGATVDRLDFPGFLLQYGRPPLVWSPRQLRLIPEPVEWETIGMKSCLVVQTVGDELYLQFPCREDCYDAATIDRALIELEAILRAAASDPDRRVGR